MLAAPWEIAAGFALDVVFGDPRRVPHPVRGAGRLIAAGERFWRWTPLPLRLSGALLWVTVTATCAGLVWLTLPWLTVYWIWSLLALRGLDGEATRVVRSLDSGNLDRARAELSMIVGRDTAALSEAEVLRAAIETVAENASDAVVAPLFWLAVGGPAAMAAYKAVNTMDSMIGYRDERYAEFGWFAARMDDAANFIPARLTAVLAGAAAFLLRLDGRLALRMAWRDGCSQPSPNAGWPEAAFAGALGVRLGGVNHYRGVPSAKPFLGDPLRELSVPVFHDARRLLYTAALLMLGLTLAAAR